MTASLVIGANGFIGSHLVDSLAAAGDEVTAFDRFASGVVHYDADARKVAGDFFNQADLTTALEGQEVVFHFLSTTSPMSTQFEPTLDVRSNVLQSVLLLENAVRAGVRHVYFASSGGAIYGHQPLTRFAETDAALPVSPYAIGKLAIERYLEYFHLTHGIGVTALRISNPYGTRQHPSTRQGLIPIALRHVIEGEPVTRMGDGSMVRDYVFVEDLAEMIARLHVRGPRQRLYNVGSGTGYSVADVLGVIEAVTGRPLEIDEVAVPTTFVPHVVLDVARYAEEFGMPPLTSLADGIARTYQAMTA